jgi:hypothetical protein
MIQQRSVRLIALLLAGFLCVGADCLGSSKGAVSGISALKSEAEKAIPLLAGEAKPAEYSALSGRLKQMAAEVPNPAGLKDDEKAVMNTADQTANALQEIFDLFGATESIKKLISPDSVTLVRGWFLRQHSPEFEAKMDQVAEKVLTDTTCGLFSDEMSRLTARPTFTPRPGTVPARPTTNVYGALNKAITDASLSVSTVQQYVNLSGLSNQILSKASDYLGRAKNTVAAASWQNGGATRAYLEVCVYK